MRKLCPVPALLLALLPLTAAAAEAKVFAAEAVPAKKEYVLYVNFYDWGAAADKAIIHCAKAQDEKSVKAEDFTADVIIHSASGEEHSGYGIVKGHRTIEAAYLCDKDGKRVSGKSQYIALELKVGPEEKLGNPFLEIPVITKFNQTYGMRICNDELDISISKRTAVVSKEAAAFARGSSQTGDCVMEYLSWEPEKKSPGTPLIIWLHGSSDGSTTNVYRLLFNTKAANLISGDIQQHFPQGACVLLPQCPVNWMISEDGDPLGNKVWVPVDIEGKVRKVTKPIRKILRKIFSLPEPDLSQQQAKAAVSFYTKPLKQLIDSYIAQHPFIDTNRIYIGGCSAGGYMTLNMCLEYKDFFAAAFPVCEAYPDSKITDRGIESLAGMPLWFTYAANDETVEPEEHTEPTVQRIRQQRPADLHVSRFEDVRDTSGQYKQPDENGRPTKAPYQYEGHYAWIYALNNQCSDGALSLFAWLSRQKRTGLSASTVI